VGRAAGGRPPRGAPGRGGGGGGAPPGAAELTHMAAWLGLERVVVADRGDLAPALARALS
jgi:hypothetical protein